ncbi:protein-arginine deiminase family protein [Kribbella sp. NPDC026611]|uniref:protein-arginine deiminase family protein n=1 Tax=Kribbella sp. NPDC026611 TaxID=3154911 RepID=UPI0033FEE0EB
MSVLPRALLSIVASGGLVAAAPLAATAGGTAFGGLRLDPVGRGLFLANLDDDSGRCQAPAKKIAAAAVDREAANDEAFQKRKEELDKEPDREKAEREYQELVRAHQKHQNLADRELAACNDAADNVVNGAADERDLARIRTMPWATAPHDAVGTLSVSVPDRVHLFVKRTTWEPATRLSAQELRHGAELGIEGRDVIRDSAVWDGTAKVTLTVAGAGSSTVTMREAPVLTQLNTQRLQQVLTAATGDEDAEGKQWRADAEKLIKSTGAPGGLRRLDQSGDEWTQDIFEPAYTSMPGPDGRPQGMKVLIGSANDDRRVASRVIFTELAGPGVAAVHVEHVPSPDENSSYDSMGNLETIPATPQYPNGRIVIGGDGTPAHGPAPEMLTLLKSQGVQDPISVDTSWLTIGHVDEFIQFVPVPGSRLGWRAVVADPTAGLKILDQVRRTGHGADKLHGNLPPLEWPYDERIDQRSVNEFLADKQFVGTNEQAAAKISANLAVLKARGGLKAADVVRVPALYTARSLDWAILETEVNSLPAGPERDAKQAQLDALREGVAEVPGTVNGLVLNPGHYLAPTPYGPVVGGKDLFAAAIDKALGRIGYQVTYVSDLISTHVSEGELHCATNTLRDSLSNRWWTS